MAGIDVNVQVEEGEEDFTEGESPGEVLIIAHCHTVRRLPDRTDELKLRATKKKGRGFGGECLQLL